MALDAGARAPEITLPLLGGAADFSLQHARQRGPVLAAFFKVSCPVCQMAFPYLQRIFANYGAKGLTIVGVSQDNAKDTQAFIREFGLTFPVALDELKKYPASNAYKLTNVPSLFWISPEGVIRLSSVGWSKAEFEQLNQEAAQAAGVAAKPLFKPGESVTDFRPG